MSRSWRRDVVETGVLAPAAIVARRVTAGRLRVLGYHGVDDPAAFEAQLRHLVERYRPVSSSEVAAAARGEATLPPRAVWVTFDDGYRSVVEHAADALARHGVRATLFVCPGVIATGGLHWWDVAELAERRGIAADVPGPAGLGVVARLKRLHDVERRRWVEHLSDAVETEQAEPWRRVCGETDLRRWRDAGHDLGNHTWDHPLLPRVERDDAVEQVERAHRWLVERGLLGPEPAFAHPNGDVDTRVLPALRDLGYELVVEFDHRLDRRRPAAYSVSRLRIDAGASVARFSAVLSGAHSGGLRTLDLARRAVRRAP